MPQSKFFCIIIIGFTALCLSACSADESFLSSRCSAPEVKIRTYNEYEFLFGTNVGQISKADLAAHITAKNQTSLWLLNNVTYHTSNGEVFLRNAIIEQKGNNTRVITAGNTQQPASIVEPVADQSVWYSLNNGISNDNKWELIVTAWKKTGPGQWDFAPVATEVVILEETNLAIQKRTSILTNTDLLMGSAFIEDQGYYYIFGTRNNDLTKEAYMARVPLGSLTQTWNYFDGFNWNADQAQARPLMNNVSDYYTVFKLDGTYYWVSQTSLFGQEVYLYRSDKLTENWQYTKTLYCKSSNNDHMLSANTLVYNLVDDELICGYSLLPDDLTKGGNEKPVFIAIENWK